MFFGWWFGGVWPEAGGGWKFLYRELYREFVLRGRYEPREGPLVRKIINLTVALCQRGSCARYRVSDFQPRPTVHDGPEIV